MDNSSIDEFFKQFNRWRPGPADYQRDPGASSTCDPCFAHEVAREAVSILEQYVGICRMTVRDDGRIGPSAIEDGALGLELEIWEGSTARFDIIFGTSRADGSKRRQGLNLEKLKSDVDGCLFSRIYVASFDEAWLVAMELAKQLQVNIIRVAYGDRIQ